MAPDLAAEAGLVVLGGQLDQGYAAVLGDATAVVSPTAERAAKVCRLCEAIADMVTARPDERGPHAGFALCSVSLRRRWGGTSEWPTLAS